MNNQEYQISVTAINQLLKTLGRSNIEMMDRPIFQWDGETVDCEQKENSIKEALTWNFKADTEIEALEKFLDDHKEEKIVLVPFPCGNLVIGEGKYKSVRAFVD